VVELFVVFSPCVGFSAHSRASHNRHFLRSPYTLRSTTDSMCPITTNDWQPARSRMSSKTSGETTTRRGYCAARKATVPRRAFSSSHHSSAHTNPPLVCTSTPNAPLPPLPPLHLHLHLLLPQGRQPTALAWRRTRTLSTAVHLRLLWKTRRASTACANEACPSCTNATRPRNACVLPLRTLYSPPAILRCHYGRAMLWPANHRSLNPRSPRRPPPEHPHPHRPHPHRPPPHRPPPHPLYVVVSVVAFGVYMPSLSLSLSWDPSTHLSLCLSVTPAHSLSHWPSISPPAVVSGSCAGDGHSASAAARFAHKRNHTDPPCDPRTGRCAACSGEQFRCCEHVLAPG
jgi:hypothetical protein